MPEDEIAPNNEEMVQSKPNTADSTGQFRKRNGLKMARDCFDTVDIIKLEDLHGKKTRYCLGSL